MFNFQVDKKKLILEDGSSSPFFATVRSDNNAILGCVHKDYKVFQPQEMYNSVEELCKEVGYEIFKEMEIQEGKKLLLSVKTGEINIADDKLIKQITICNSYDKSSSLAFNFGNLNLSCQNQFYKVITSSDSRFRHKGNLSLDVNTMLKEIKKVNLAEENFYKKLDSFTTKKITKDLAVKAMKSVLDYSDTEEVSSRKKNQLERFLISFDIETQRIGKTAWGLFNAATYYSTHVLKQTTNGVGQKISNDMFTEILKIK